MTVETLKTANDSARPFGFTFLDPDIKILVASADVRYQQQLRAVIVRRTAGDDPILGLFALELVVLNSAQNLEALRSETRRLDVENRLNDVVEGVLSDVVLRSSTSNEAVMLTLMPEIDFRRVEQISLLEQAHIGAPQGRGSWVCRIIDAERLDALFSGRLIDVR